MTAGRLLDVDMPKRGIQFVAHRQGSSAVEQGTHKPLVGSSTLPPGTLEPLRDTVHYGRGRRLKNCLDVVHLVGKKHTLLRSADHLANRPVTTNISESALKEQAAPNPRFPYPNVHGCEK